MVTASWACTRQLGYCGFVFFLNPGRIEATFPAIKQVLEILGHSGEKRKKQKQQQKKPPTQSQGKEAQWAL